MDFDTLEAQGNSAVLAVDTMRGRSDRYDPDVLGALAPPAVPNIRDAFKVRGAKADVLECTTVSLAIAA